MLREIQSRSQEPRACQFVNNLARALVEAGATALDAKFKVRLGVHAPRGQSPDGLSTHTNWPTGPSPNLTSPDRRAPLKVSYSVRHFGLWLVRDPQRFWGSLCFCPSQCHWRLLFLFFFGSRGFHTDHRSCRAELTEKRSTYPVPGPRSVSA